MKEQAARINIIHQKEFLWPSAAIWEQLLERKKEQLCPSQETKEELMCLEGCECSQYTSGTRMDGSKEMKLSWKRF